MRTKLILFGSALVILGGLLYYRDFGKGQVVKIPHIISVKSIDSMKYSRDLAREKNKDDTFNVEIETQISNIAATGATHVAVATPYDSEFLPYLVRWVDSARRHNLHVWFRGNLSGWENWFDYPSIGRTEHTKKIVEFIQSNKDLFKDGDIFTSCPECENGGPGDPRKTGDVRGHRNFLIAEKKAVDSAFASLNLNVQTGYYSMNGDVAKLIMDPRTTQELGGFVTVDHYVATPEQLVSDLAYLHQKSGGLIVLGEWGAPIPDIQGEMTQDQQAEWINRVTEKLRNLPYLEGVNYWTNKGGSTLLWENDNTPRKAVKVIENFYKK